jgi:guanylate kinase
MTRHETQSLGPDRGPTRSFPIVISGPSGVGKTSIIERLPEFDPGVRLSVSVTTRPRRAGEVEGRDYHFLTREEFERRRAAGALVEWAEVHGYGYGTPREPVERWLAEGYDALLDIDYQGGLKIKQVYPGAALIFILPPSWSELEARLRGRQSDPEADVARRLDDAAAEIAQAARYDYFVVNSDLELAYEQVLAIVMAERQRVFRLARDVESLIEGARPPAGRPARA